MIAGSYLVSIFATDTYYTTYMQALQIEYFIAVLDVMAKKEK